MNAAAEHWGRAAASQPRTRQQFEQFGPRAPWATKDFMSSPARAKGSDTPEQQREDSTTFMVPGPDRRGSLARAACQRPE